MLTRLRDAGLKVNTAKLFFCTHEIEYLSYLLMREGTKPQLKKVQAILALEPPQNVKGLRHFLGMVQYYRDMWVKHSEMLAGVVHANVGQNVTLLTFPLRLFFIIFSTDTSS